jgi:hypothetical protein
MAFRKSCNERGFFGGGRELCALLPARRARRGGIVPVVGKVAGAGRLVAFYVVVLAVEGEAHVKRSGRWLTLMRRAAADGERSRLVSTQEGDVAANFYYAEGTNHVSPFAELQDRHWRQGDGREGWRDWGRAEGANYQRS